MRKDDAAVAVPSKSGVENKGFPVGGNIETDDDTGFNRQLPPGEYIENQMYASDEKRIAGLPVHSASSILASGTKKLG